MPDNNMTICYKGRFKAVIFDLDGTLIDSLEDIARSLNKTLLKFKFRPFPVDEYKKLIGDGIDKMIFRALKKQPGFDKVISPALIKDIIAGYRHEYSRCWRLNSRPYPGIPKLLSELNRRKIKIGVLSNKAHVFTEAIVREIFPLVRFQSIEGARPGFPLKPDPGPALIFANKMSVTPGECIFLGDTAIDMTTANLARMYPVGALWGFREAPELINSGARALIAQPLELLRFF